MKYYDGGRLLNSVDINGNKPEIYLTTSNRSTGKTTYFNSKLVREFIKKGEKFMLLYRYNYELDDIADKFFKDIQVLFFPQYTMSCKKRNRGVYSDLYINDIHCGYAVSINNAEQIKKLSHLFSDTAKMFMDEFQSETNTYAPNEVNKFISIHTSVARGNGKMVRYVPVYLCSNPVTILNPYFVALGISDRLRQDTKFLKGDGYCLENGFNIDASNAQKDSAFNRAFANNRYVQYAAEAVYLKDNQSFIDKPTGKGRYLATIKSEGKFYSVHEFGEEGIIYCTNTYDPSFKNRIALETDDHDINFIMLKRNSLTIQTMRYFFSHGCFRFRNMDCKNVILKLLAYGQGI